VPLWLRIRCKRYCFFPDCASLLCYLPDFSSLIQGWHRGRKTTLRRHGTAWE